MIINIFTNVTFFSLSALFAFFFFSLPIIFDWEVNYPQSYKSLPIYAATGSIEFKISVYCSIAATLPMLLELVLRLLSNPSTIYVYKSVISNIVLMLSLLIPDMLLLSYVIPHLDLVALNIVINCRIVLLLWTTSTFLSVYGGPIFKLRITKYWYVIILGQRLVDFCGIYSSICSSILPILLGILGAAIFSYHAFLWFREYNKLSKLQKLTTDYYLSNIYVISLCITMFGIGLVFMSNNFQSWIHFTSADLAAFTCVDTIYYVLMFALQGNALQREATINQNMLSVKRIFFRYMSHEIRTPLNTVMMGLQFLEEDMMKRGDSPVRRQTIGEIKESCDIAIKTLNDMLIYDKIETGGLVLDKVNMDILELVETTTRPFQLQASYSNINLRIDKVMDESEVCGPLLVSVDASKMSQVFRNIISNALKFTPGGGSITITMSIIQQQQQQEEEEESLLPIVPMSSNYLFTRTSSVLNRLSTFRMRGISRPLTATVLLSPKIIQQYIKIVITDTGYGISEENQRELFHGIIQFSPGKLQSGGGSGLGLYISKGIVDSHGGSLSVHSQGEGFGSTFTVILPLLTVFPITSPIASPSLASSKKYHPQPNPADPPPLTVLSRSMSTAVPLPPERSPTNYGLYTSLSYLRNTTPKIPLLTNCINSRCHSTMVVLPDDKSQSREENNLFDKATSLPSHSEVSFMKNGGAMYQISPSPSSPSPSSPSFPSSPNRTINTENKPMFNYISKNQTVTSSSSYLGNIERREEEDHRNNYQGNDCSVKSICSDDVNENENAFISDGERVSQESKARSSQHHRSAYHRSDFYEVKEVEYGRCSTSKQELTGTYPNGQYRLLVVDDVVMNRKMLIRLLGDRCSLIREAANGLEAVEQVREAARIGVVFDVITMDYQMPIMDGPTATQKIRELGYQGIILGLTGNVLPSDMNVFLSHGVNRVLAKPLDIKIFDMTLQELSASVIVSRRSSSVRTRSSNGRYFPGEKEEKVKVHKEDH